MLTVPLTRNYGEPLEVAKQRQWFIKSMPMQFRHFLNKKHQKDSKKLGYAAANWSLFQFEKMVKLKGTGLTGASSADQVREYADLISRRLERDFLSFAHSAGMDKAVEWVVSEVRARGLEFPCDIEEADKQQKVAAFARVFSSQWWARNLLRKQRHTMEQIARMVGMVTGYTSPYASEWARDRRQEQKDRNRALLESMEVVNADDESEVLNLLECVERSVSNPVNRRHELMTRMSGFEQVSQQFGHKGMFYTITCPSKFHCKHSGSGETVENYNGATPKQAQEYLCGQWAKIRAKLKRKGVDMYGFRVAEPHHDGTPHWHMLLFMLPENEKFVTQVIRDYAMQVDGSEAGAVKYRFEAVPIDYSKGSATGYIAKYIAKNIDGAHIDYDDETGTDGLKRAILVDAWASTWNIRQFQQIGGPSVSLWRELRRLSVDEISDYYESIKADFEGLDRLNDQAQAESCFEDFRRMWKAADEGDWYEFCFWGGGCCMGRISNIALEKTEYDPDELPGIDIEELADFVARANVEGITDEDQSGDMGLFLQSLRLENQFGEWIEKVVGVRGVVRTYATRLKRWVIRPTKGGEASEAQAEPWSSVNNCTEQETELIKLDMARGSG